jgi:hypothetical protein
VWLAAISLAFVSLAHTSPSQHLSETTQAPPELIITGRVLDDQGNPAARANVRAFIVRPTTAAKRQGPQQSSADTYANEDGTFTLKGLETGDYLLNASLFDVDPIDAPTTLAPTFYPGVTVSTDAVPISVTVRNPVAHVQFAMRRVPAVNVFGAVVDVDGKIPAEAAVQMFRRDYRLGGGWHTVARKDGTFMLSGVPPGRYTVFAVEVTHQGGAREWTVHHPPLDERAAPVEIAVGDKELSGLMVTMDPLPQRRRPVPQDQ